MEHLAQHIESLIFTTEQPISLKEIKSCLETVFEQKFQEEELLATLETLKSKFQAEDFAFEIVEVADGYQFLTKGGYFQTIATYLKINAKKKLSRAAIETLSLIAYKQPVTKSAMEKIRGVSCDYSVQKLLEKELITIAGRSDGPGRPLLYGTSAKFMDYMGIKNLNELPKIKDFKTPENEIGEAAPIEESENIQHTPLTDQDTPPSEANPDGAAPQEESAKPQEYPIVQNGSDVEQNPETDNVLAQENANEQNPPADNATQQDNSEATQEEENPDFDNKEIDSTQQNENDIEQNPIEDNTTQQDNSEATQEEENPDFDNKEIDGVQQNESSSVENIEEPAGNIVTPLPEHLKNISEEE